MEFCKPGDMFLAAWNHGGGILAQKFWNATKQGFSHQNNYLKVYQQSASVDCTFIAITVLFFFCLFVLFVFFFFDTLTF